MLRVLWGRIRADRDMLMAMTTGGWYLLSMLIPQLYEKNRSRVVILEYHRSSVTFSGDPILVIVDAIRT